MDAVAAGRPVRLADQVVRLYAGHRRCAVAGILPGRMAGGDLGPQEDRSERVLAVSAVAAFAFSQAGSVAAVLGFGMLLSASNLGAWGVLYAVTPEIYPTRLRAAASGAAAACGRVAAIIAPLLMPWFLTLSGGNKAVAFIVFAVAFILACVAALCLPERTGKELED